MSESGYRFKDAGDKQRGVWTDHEKALEGGEREREIQRELDEIRRNREFSYALLRWLRSPSSPAGAIPGGVREE
jgi:hypothetical protein